MKSKIMKFLFLFLFVSIPVHNFIIKNTHINNHNKRLLFAGLENFKRPEVPQAPEVPEVPEVPEAPEMPQTPEMEYPGAPNSGGSFASINGGSVASTNGGSKNGGAKNGGSKNGGAKNGKNNWVTAILIILVIYVVMTYRVWGGFYFHNPERAPYGFMSSRKLKLSDKTLGKKNIRALKELNYFTDNNKKTIHIKVSKMLRDLKITNNKKLNKIELFSLTKEYFKRNYSLTNKKLDKFLKSQVNYFFKDKKHILKKVLGFDAN